MPLALIVWTINLYSDQTRPYNVGKSVNMRELDPADLDKLVSIKGLVTRVTGVTPDMREGRFLITCFSAC